MPRTRFPLLESPDFRPYAPLINQCIEALIEGNGRWPHHAALVCETPAAPDLSFGSPAQVAETLRDMAAHGSREAAEALLRIAVEICDPQRAAESGFDCVVVTRRGCALLRLPSVSRAEQGAYAVRTAVAALRGFSRGSPPPDGIVGMGYAIRSPSCVPCQAWADALRAAKIPSVGRVSPEASPLVDDRCQACHAERDSLRRLSATLYGLDAAETDAATEPASVLEWIWCEEDFDLANR